MLRVKSVAPISLSSAATMREADGWESSSSRAAREKLPERAVLGDECRDLWPQLRLLRDLARRPVRASSLDLSRGKSQQFHGRPGAVVAQ